MSLPDDGFDAYYPLTILALSAIAVLAFQAVDIYHVAGLPRGGAAVLAAARGLDHHLPDVFALVFFARLDGMFSRVWIATWYGTGAGMLLALRLGLAALVRHWTQQGRLVRRTVIVGGGERGRA